ncbi:MAG: methyltransferase domain-containing protein [Anaerolineae bacterium]|nr:methyltransferase domain-containing protein [Anaerolineae bacterium]
MATFHQEAYDLRPWYHDFERLGLQTRFGERGTGLRHRLARAAHMVRSMHLQQLLGTRLEKREILSIWQTLGGRGPGHLDNQPVKEQVLLPYIQRSLERLPHAPRCLELFCADGYYGCAIAQQRPDAHVIGIDLAELEIRRAGTAARLLGLENAHFSVADAWEYLRQTEPFDLVLCAGGLYHLEQPRQLLALLRPVTSAYLVVQSVVTLETQDPAYFVTPAPGLRHGSRFTHAALETWLRATGWGILAQARNELPGNPLPRDRGSSYFWCRPVEE